MFQANEIQIVKSITSADINPSAKEIAGNLVEAWINEFAEFDTQFETVAVELPWFYWLQPQTLIVGVMDRVARDNTGLFGCEWKTTKEPQQNRDGRDSAWWNEEVWLESISSGVQLSIYAMAMKYGTFVERLNEQSNKFQLYNFKAKTPRIMVRAAVKSNPPRFWPQDFSRGVFEFPDNYVDKVVVPSLISKAEQLRAAKRLNTVPWALPGNHCTNRFRKLCEYHECFCMPHNHPPMQKAIGIFDDSDPGSKAIEFGLRKHPTLGEAVLRKSKDLLVLSASSFDTAQQCPEKYRILVGGFAPKEKDQNLDIGTGVHSGVAEYYRQHKESGKKTKTKKGK